MYDDPGSTWSIYFDKVSESWNTYVQTFHKGFNFPKQCEVLT